MLKIALFAVPNAPPVFVGKMEVHSKSQTEWMLYVQDPWGRGKEESLPSLGQTEKMIMPIQWSWLSFPKCMHAF